MIPFTGSKNHIYASIDGPEGAYALLCDNPKGATVFVHGFFGDADTTWREFQTLIDEVVNTHPRAASTDFYFYAYRSWEQVIPQARWLRAFLFRVVLPGATSKISLSEKLPSGFVIQVDEVSPRNYDWLILAGHSTGGVIIRQMVVEEIKGIRGRFAEHELNEAVGKSALLTTEIRLFAPAHMGAICSGKLGIFSSLPVCERLAAISLKSKPLFHNIQPNSPVLIHLREETESLRNMFGNLPALKPKCIFGSADAIVNIDNYATDSSPELADGQTHTSVCKPNLNYLIPLTFLGL